MKFIVAVLLLVAITACYAAPTPQYLAYTAPLSTYTYTPYSTYYPGYVSSPYYAYSSLGYGYGYNYAVV